MEEGRNFSVSITAGTVVKTILVLVLAWTIFLLRDVVLDVLVAIVIASAVEPGIAGLVKRRLPRILAVIVVYLALFSVFFALFYFFVPLVLEDFATFVSGLPVDLNAFMNTSAFNTYANLLGVSGSSLVPVDSIMTAIHNTLDVSVIFGNALAAATAIFGGFFSFVIIIVFSFYFAAIETGVDDFLRIVVPKKQHAYVLGLWKRCQKKIGLWMQGQLLLAVIIGVLIYLGLSIFRVPHALLLAAIAACFEIVPVFGPTLAAIPAVMVAFVDGGATLGVITIFIYAIAQQFENHLISPLVVTSVIGVPPLLVILALVAGAELAGFLGVLLAIPIAATIQELARDIESGRLGAATE